jgi:radical SAM superfamily enzyme YgiQ (UPF0313 family)
MLPQLAEKAISWILDYQGSVGQLPIHFEFLDADLDLEAYDQGGLLDFFARQKITWNGQGRIRSATPELRRVLEKAHSSGLLSLFIGIESFQQHVLDTMGKRVDASSIVPYLEALKAAGIGTSANILIGFPGQTSDDVAKDLEIALDLVARNIIDRIMFWWLVLYPGTRFRRWHEKYGITLHDPSYDRLGLVVQHSTQEMDCDEIAAWFLKATSQMTQALS